MTYVRITATEEGTSVTVNGQTVEVTMVMVGCGPLGSRLVCVLSGQRPPGDGWTRPDRPDRHASLWEIKPTRLEISAVTEPLLTDRQT